MNVNTITKLFEEKYSDFKYRDLIKDSVKYASITDDKVCAINNYIKEYNIENFVVIEDNKYVCSSFPNNSIRTDPETGFVFDENLK